MGLSSSFPQPDDQAWLAYAKQDSFLGEIEENVKRLEGAVQRGLTVDHTFFEILKKDIAAARQVSVEQQKVTEQAKKLDALALKVVLAEAKATATPSQRPEPLEYIPSPVTGLPEKPTALEADGQWKAGLRRVEDAEFTVRKIHGDGHCAFRSYIACLFASAYPKEDLLNVLKALRMSVDEKTAQELNFDLLERSVMQVQQNPKSTDTVLASLPVSDAWVKLLRWHVSRNASAAGTAEAVAQSIRFELPEFVDNPDDKNVVDQYSKRISRMDPPLYGGAREFKILDQLFGTNTVELHTESLATVQDGEFVEDIRSEEEIRRDNPNLFPIYVLRRSSNHFDAAFRA